MSLIDDAKFHRTCSVGGENAGRQPFFLLVSRRNHVVENCLIYIYILHGFVQLTMKRYYCGCFIKARFPFFLWFMQVHVLFYSCEKVINKLAY